MKKQIYLICSLVIIVASLIGGTIFSDFLETGYALLLFCLMLFVLASVKFLHNWLAKLVFGVSLFGLFILMMTQPLTLGVIIFVSFALFVMWVMIVSQITINYRTTRLSLQEPDVEKYGRVEKAYFIGEQHEDVVYDWDDMNIHAWFGDTIINLGHTILPESNINYIVIQKAVGDIHILVPFDIGIMLQHTTIKGTVFFESEHYQLQNEKLKIYSENYLDAPRKIHILTTDYIGNIEVVRI